MSPFESSGGTVPVRKGDGVELRVDGVSVTAEEGPAQTLDQTGWNRRAAARQLGISPTTLLRQIEKFGLKPTSVAT